MAYTSRIKMNKQATGANANTWGSVLNSEVFSLADQAIAGYTIVSVNVDGPIILSVEDGAVSRGRNKIIELQGTLTSAKALEIPAASREYTIINSSSGSFSCTFKVTGGGDSGTAVNQGIATKLYCNGTSVNLATGAIATRAIGVCAENIPDTSLADLRYDQLSVSQTITGAKTHTSLIESNSSIKVSSGRAYAVPYSVAYAASIILSMNESNTFFVTLTGNGTLGFPVKGQPGQSGLIYVYQDGTGSRTLSYVSCWNFSGGTAPTATTTANAVDIISYNVRAVSGDLCVTDIDAEMKTDFRDS
jgi:hypothetical protein